MQHGLAQAFCRAPLVAVFLLLFHAFSPTSPAQDLSTANTDALQRFWTAAERTNRPVTVLSFGDSMADSYQSISYVLMNRLVERLGIAGYSLINYRNALMWQVAGAARAVEPSSFWFTDHHEVMEGGSLWWEKEWTPGGVYSDRAGVFYVSQPAGGSFTISVSTNAGPWTPVMTVDSRSARPEGHFVSLDLAPDLHRLRIDGLSGTNIIIGPQLLNTRSAGVHVVFAYKGGLGLNEVTNVPLSIRLPILQALAPDLLIWHMKEDPDAPTEAALLENEAWWSDACPAMDVVYLGTPWASVDTNSSYTVDQNTLVRSVGLAHRRAYVDCMTPAVSYDWMLEQGYMRDATHVNLIGSTYLAGFAWNDLGFFALRQPRSLGFRWNEGNLAIEYPTVPGIRYVLESSAGKDDWTVLSTNEGTGSTISTDVPGGESQRFFRLRLEPGS